MMTVPKHNDFTYEQAKALEKSLTEKIEALEKLLSQQMDSDRAAVVEARRLMERSMEGFPEEYVKKAEMARTNDILNSLRENDLKTMSRRIGEMLPRAEYDIHHTAVVSDLKQLQSEKGSYVSRAELLATVVGASAIVFALIEYFTHRM